MATLTIDCPHCEDGVGFKSRHGGNDPDVWAVRCEECDGTGIETLHCDGCRNEATEMFDGAPWCAAHAAEQRAEAMLETTDPSEPNARTSLKRLMPRARAPAAGPLSGQQCPDLIEHQAEAIDAQLDRIEALLTWCREHVRPPPADLLYDAVGALQSLRRAA